MKRLIITLLLSFLAVAAVMAWRWGPLLMPSGESSDLYRHYEHNPHIRATYLRNFQVNDTLRVDVTLLQASTDSAWYALLRDFGASEEFIEWYQSNKANLVNDRQNSIFLFSMDKNNPRKRLSENDPDSRFVIGSYAKRTLCVFMTEKKIRETIIISETKKL